jgi:hypothetical protein
MKYGLFATGVLSALVMVAGCSEEDDSADTDGTGGTSTGGRGGSSGSGGGGTGGSTGGGGGTGAEAGEGPMGCATDGTGTVEIDVSGLPDDVDASGELTGTGVRETFTSDTTYDDLPTGEYSVAAEVVLDEDPIVRTVFLPTVSGADFCLEDGATEVVNVTYDAIPSSNKLWTSNLLGFPSSELAASGEGDPVVAEAPAGKDIAFDADGNLWAFGATLAEPLLVRFPAAELGESGEKTWDLAFGVPAIECIPAVRALAFDGPDLWLSVCGNQVMKFRDAMHAESGDLEPDLVISELPGNEDIATNDQGLWVASGSSILFYESRADGMSSAPPDLTLTVRDAEDSRDLDPTGLTFDAEGNLWGFCFGSNGVFKVNADDLEQTGEQTVVADVSFFLGVDILVAPGAFDNGGGLWVSYGGGRLGRFSPDQLEVSSGTGEAATPERIVTNDALESELSLAFFANPPGVPLAPGYD